MFAKKVELTELFYDLVFVFAISQMTSLIHHLHMGVLPFISIMNFLFALVVAVNTWMIQTVYTNRYGKNSPVNIFFMLASMVLVLILSNSFTADWSEGINFYTFILLVAGLTVVLLLQYFWEFFQAKDAANQRIIRFFIFVLTARGILLLLSLMLPFAAAASFSFLVVVATTLAPLFYTKAMAAVPTNFPHLVERLGLLTLLLFGEMLVGIAPYFQPTKLGWSSLLVFLIAVSLFLTYYLVSDFILDHKKKKVTGNGLIYFHYPIFIGLSMMTVALSFFRDADVKLPFLYLFSLLALGFFYLGILLMGRYSKKEVVFNRFFISSQLLAYSIGALAAYMMTKDSFLLLLVLGLTVFTFLANFYYFYLDRKLKNNKKK